MTAVMDPPEAELAQRDEGILSAPERSLLLKCARQEIAPTSFEEIRCAIEAGVSWPRLVRAAWRHGVASLLHANLAHAELSSLVPGEAKQSLRQCYVRAAFRNESHFNALAALLPEFERRGVPVMLLKGAALSLTLYRERALRPFADIDLLIVSPSIDGAKEALFAAGYMLGPELLSENLSRRFHSNLPFVRRGQRPVHIELHWDLTDRFSNYAFDHAALFNRARRIRLMETTALVLEPHDDLVYLAAHLDKHGFVNRVLADTEDPAAFVLDELSANRLIWFTDLHEHIVHNDLDWDEVRRRCDSPELSDAVASSLVLLEKVLGTPVPAGWSRRRARAGKRGVYNLVRRCGAQPASRAFLERRILSTRKSFELRLIRLPDVWAALFPRCEASISERIGHALRVSREVVALAIALVIARVRKIAQR